MQAVFIDCATAKLRSELKGARSQGRLAALNHTLVHDATHSEVVHQKKLTTQA